MSRVELPAGPVLRRCGPASRRGGSKACFGLRPSYHWYTWDLYLAVIRPLTHLNSLPGISFLDTDGERFGDRPKLWVTVWVYRQSVRRQCLGKWWVGGARATPPSTPLGLTPIWGVVRVHLVPATHPPNFSPIAAIDKKLIFTVLYLPRHSKNILCACAVAIRTCDVQNICRGVSFHACKIYTQSTEPFSRYSMGWVIGRWCTCHFPPPPYGSDPLYGVSFVSTRCRLPTHQISARLLL